MFEKIKVLAFLGIFLSVSALIVSCEGQIKTPGSLANRQNFADLVNLAEVNGCLPCHKVNASVIGPAWDLVANRYRNVPNARQMLIEKVKSGGSGSWTTITGGAVMPPYSPRVSDADIEKLVDYILAIK